MCEWDSSPLIIIRYFRVRRLPEHFSLFVQYQGIFSPLFVLTYERRRKQTDYPELEFRPSLRAFMRQRADLLTVLEPLPIDAWSRTVLVTTVGKALERTLLSYGAAGCP